MKLLLFSVNLTNLKKYRYNWCKIINDMQLYSLCNIYEMSIGPKRKQKEKLKWFIKIPSKTRFSHNCKSQTITKRLNDVCKVGNIDPHYKILLTQI